MVTAKAYLLAIDGEEDRHIVQAVKRFIRGEVKDQNPRFAPTTAELAQEVRRLADLEAWQQKAAALPALPNYVVQTKLTVTPEMQAKVGKLMAALASELREGAKR